MTSYQAPSIEPRCERKYLVTHTDFETVCTWIRLHPFGFNEAYPPRSIHNLYLDTLDLQTAQASITGLSSRYKVRWRWYQHQDQVQNPCLEIKYRQADYIYKTSYPLPKPNIFPKPYLYQHHKELANLLPQPAKLYAATLHPSLFNWYQRHYFINPYQSLRLTIDHAISSQPLYGSTNPKHATTHNQDSIVMELKYHPRYEQEAMEASQHFPVSLTKQSKYLAGLSTY